MSKIEGVKCDACGKISFDYMLDKWIVIDGNFTKYAGRKKTKEAFSEIFLPTKMGGYHFCSWNCLTKIRR